MNHAVSTDIDIDFADRDAALSGLLHIPASTINKEGQITRHPTGVYFQDVPTDPFTNHSSIPYDETGQLGYFKVDFLNNSIYASVRDNEHLDELVARDPDWSLFEHSSIVAMLSHIHNHFGIVQNIRPQSIEDLAIVLALMRPGKRHLVGRPREEIEAKVWSTDAEGYVFKRAHALAYAVSIVVQLNLICEAAAAELEAENEPELIQF